MKMQRTLFILVLGVLGFGLAAGPAHALSTQKFVEKASTGGQFEISSARLALQNSQNDNIKALAQQMLDDHTQIANQLKSTASSVNMVDYQPTPAVEPQQQKMLDRLGSLQGPAFDKRYLDQQIKAHRETVALFRNYAKNGDNGALRTFAAQTLPTLQSHLDHALQLQKSISG